MQSDFKKRKIISHWRIHENARSRAVLKTSEISLKFLQILSFLKTAAREGPENRLFRKEVQRGLRGRCARAFSGRHTFARGAGAAGERLAAVLFLSVLERIGRPDLNS